MSVSDVTYSHVTITDIPGNYWLPQLAQDTANVGDNLSEDRQRQRYKLEDDPMCGLTTGGQEECYWDCDFFVDPYFGSMISNPECLGDCYSEVLHVTVCETIALHISISRACNILFL